MEFLKLLFYKSYCWQRKMDPNSDTLFDAVTGFSVLVSIWGTIVSLDIVIIIDKIFNTEFLSEYGNIATYIFLIMYEMSFVLPYAWLRHKRNYFKLLLSMHRLYKDEYPDFMLEIFLFTGILLMGSMLIVCLTR